MIQSPNRPHRVAQRSVAFTLIELLVVISIIGVLAAMSVGLTGLATRKSKESRIRAEMTKVSTAIENYKSVLGFYPPDHQVVANQQSVPAPNQLYYELSGAVFRNGMFYIPGSSEGLSGAVLQKAFGTSGIANSARDNEKDIKFTESFKPSQYKRISANPPIDVLAVPVKGTRQWTIGTGANAVNPWLYISTSPTNNPDRYDLWTEVVIGGKTMRFSNWEKDPVVISP